MKRGRFLAFFWGLFTSIIFVIVLFFTLLSGGVIGEIPDYKLIENPKTAVASEIWSADGVLLGKIYDKENRSIATFNELPDNLKNALLATEDIRYFDHSGIDARSLYRAISGVMTGTSKGGGSTITQQLAKNLFSKKKRSNLQRVIQKLNEWVIAVRLESRYTKEEIMAMYLNTVEFNNQAWGIKSAARTYFNKTVDSLKIQESAVLVGMLKGPTLYNPRQNPESSKKRRNTVLSQMVKYKFLKEEIADSLYTQPIILDFNPSSHQGGIATHFREHVRLELQDWLKEFKNADGKSDYNIYSDGLKIYTTIDTRLQRHAENAVHTHMAELQKKFFEDWKKKDPWKGQDEELKKALKTSEYYQQLKKEGVSEDSIRFLMKTPVRMKIFTWTGEKDTIMTPEAAVKYHRMFLQAGFLVVDPFDGSVKAWVGGVNFKYNKLDHTLTRRQIGSTFKPFLYATAVDNGYSPCYKVFDVPVTFEDYKNWTPKNSPDKFTGEALTLKQCLAKSKNSCSAYLMKQLGPETIIKLARDLGIKSPIEPVPSICLGTPDLSLMEMTGSYTAFVNKGVYTKPQYISRIEDKEGNLIHEFPTERKEVLREHIAYTVIELLRAVTTWGGTAARLRAGSYPYQLIGDLGGKTGTTQNSSDGWFMGVTPELVAGAWVGGEDRFMRFNNDYIGQGAVMALPIWGLFFRNVYNDKTLGYDETKIFPPPSYPFDIELDCSQYKQTDDEKEKETKYGGDFE